MENGNPSNPSPAGNTHASQTSCGDQKEATDSGKDGKAVKRENQINGGAAHGVLIRIPPKTQVQEDTDSDDDGKTLAALGLVGMVGNPKDKKDKHQRRMEPKKYGAPTTKSNKEAAKRSNRVRKETAKMVQFQNNGKNSDGTLSY